MIEREATDDHSIVKMFTTTAHQICDDTQTDETNGACMVHIVNAHNVLVRTSKRRFWHR